MDEQQLDLGKQVLDEALALPEAERADHVRSVCGDDDKLVGELLSLLGYEQDAPQWPEMPLVPSISEGPNAERAPELARLSDWTPSSGDRFGRYRVERTLGRGGMGAVALAVREDDFEKRVALKVLGAISPTFVRRFAQERQMLARLEHQNVARLLDGGTSDDGRPWFAMEYVDGLPIDRYCEQHDLSLRARLELVIQVCSGLEVAHRNLVVHRDIKPANILVPADGLPKILDFGIAKSLAPQDVTELTHISERPMTPRWASPEQVCAEPITTATDVYGVGLLLYRLLTGQHAFEEKSEIALIAAIKECPPPRPSTRLPQDPARRKAVAGDLDAIVCKALRKAPADRYGSVAALAHDLQRHLDGAPVEARDGDRWYRFSRFLKRNWLPVSAATLLLVLGLTFGTVATVLKVAADEARIQAEQAQAQETEAREQSDATFRYFQELLWTSNPDESDGTFIQWIQNAEEKLDEYDDPIVQARLLGTIGRTYSEWGEFERAVNSWQRALALVRETPEATGSDRAIALNNLASGFFMTGDYRQAADLYGEALAMKEELAPDDIDFALALANQASANMRLGDLDQVESLYRGALEIRLGEAEPKVGEIGNSYRGLAAYYLEIDHYAESETASREALRYLYEASEGKPTTRIASVGTGLGRALHGQGDAEAALTEYQQAMAIRVDRFGTDHLHVTSSHLDQARALIDLERYPDAMEQLVAAEAWLDGQPSRRWGSYRARAQVLGGVLAMRQGSCAASIREALAGGYESLTAGRERPDHYGRRAAAWLAEFDAACPSIQIEKSLAIDG